MEREEFHQLTAIEKHFYFFIFRESSLHLQATTTHK